MISAKWARRILDFNNQRHYITTQNEIEMRITEAIANRRNNVHMTIPFEEEKKIKEWLELYGYKQEWIKYPTWLEVIIEW